MKSLLLFTIRGYQRMVSPTLAPSCRYEPTCSHYGYEAIERYGAIRGSWLMLRRLGRCHPLHSPGFDPVP